MTGPTTQASGSSIKHPEKVPCTMPMVISMKESGKMISPMALGNINILMGSFTRVSGKTTNNMAEESKSGQMDKNTKANLTKASSQEKESLGLTTDRTTKASFPTIKFTAKVISMLI